MSKLYTINNILQELLEARSHPELNPKISGYEALKPYANDPDIYISYTSIDKIGINPKSSYNTPFGIYTYPLKGTIWNEIEKAKDSHAVPFAGDNPYIWILKSKNKSKFVKDLYKDYTSKDYDEDMNKIRKLYSDKVEDIEQLIDRSTKLSKDQNADNL